MVASRLPAPSQTARLEMIAFAPKWSFLDHELL